jgi:ribonucleotide monophosphatase NagD (HAD superfamily)
LDASPDGVVMVGDDLISDLRPAAAIGMRTGLVRTGKGASMTPEPGELTYDEPDLARLADRLLS